MKYSPTLEIKNFDSPKSLSLLEEYPAMTSMGGYSTESGGTYYTPMMTSDERAETHR